MKAPIAVQVRTDNVGTHIVKLLGADGDSKSLTIVLPHGSSAYQSLHAVAPALGDLITEILRDNGVADFVAPEPAPDAPAEVVIDQAPSPTPKAKRASKKKA